VQRRGRLVLREVMCRCPFLKHMHVCIRRRHVQVSNGLADDQDIWSTV
jgi:hypothetical protein